MQQKTRGLVLNAINYNDKYMLVPIFTEIGGRITYMVSKTKSKNTKVSKAIFYPLAILELEVEHQASRDIQRIREARSVFHFFDIPSNMTKTSIAFFLSDFLSRVLKDVNDGRILFDFLFQSVKILEMTENSVANFHIVLMLKLSRLMGFYPNLEEYANNSYFDMINGEFVVNQPLHKHYLNRSDSRVLAQIARISYENMHKFVFSRQDRISIINKMLDYYRLHSNDFPELKSLDVLPRIILTKLHLQNMTLEDVKKTYTNTIDREKTKLAHLKKNIFRIGSVRLLLVLASISICYTLWGDTLAIAITIGTTMIAMLFLLKYHNTLFIKRKYCELQINNAENELKGIDYNFSGIRWCTRKR